MKTFLIRDENAFKLRAKVYKCDGIKDLNCIEFTGEQYNNDGDLTDTSTYQFFLEDTHVKAMVEGLTA
jgi:hypothetical protein